MIDLREFHRRKTTEVAIGQTRIGGGNPIAVQSMTNTPTADVEQSVGQIERIADAGAPIVRLTAQGRKEGEAFARIMPRLRGDGYRTAIVADIHFVPEIASIAADYVNKVRINPGNYRLTGGDLERLIAKCRAGNVALRIGVNHGSLARHIFDRYGDTPEGMVASAMEFLRICQRERFDQVVVSMKSSNTRVMVQAYRLLVRQMDAEQMHYPLHIGVTEAGNGLYGRIKSAVGIGALLADGIGDTIRVSLTEAPENEIPVARLIVDHFSRREGSFEVSNPEAYSPLSFRRRSRMLSAVTHDELTPEYTVIESTSGNPTHEWRAAILAMNSDRPVVLKRTYTDTDPVTVGVRAGCDMGLPLLDGLADGVWIVAPALSMEQVREIELDILQAARLRMEHTEYIACPSCGRTLYDIESTLGRIKEATGHLKGIRIGVMGCIVNGPGEMADADYGYVGAAPGRITLYRGTEIVERNIDQREAIDHLIGLIRKDGKWTEKP